MEIIYLETIPDVDIYDELRTSVGWVKFCPMRMLALRLEKKFTLKL